MIDGPSYLRLESRLACAGLAAAVAIVRPLVEALGLRVCSLDGGASEDGWPARLPDSAHRLAMDFAGSGLGALHPAHGLADAFQFNLGFDVAACEPAAVCDVLAVLAGVAAGLADSGGLLHVAIYRQDGGQAMPITPLAGVATHLVSATDAEVAAAYADAKAFAAAWDRSERHGDVSLYLRGMDAVGNPSFLAHVLPGQMAMVRAARPGQVRFAQPDFAQGEFGLLDAGMPTLTGVGYDSATRTYEFAGYLPDGGDLRAIDLMLAARVVADGYVEDAEGNRHPVDHVRAVFDSRVAAGRALPLLASASVETLWMNDEGDLVAP